jgi:DNA-binding XRE family transcriptional regulator
MDRDWKRLGHAIKARREELGIGTQQSLADAAGVTRQSVQSLEAGKARTRMPSTIRHIEKALQWEHGTAARVLAGDTPPASKRDSAPQLAQGMPARVLQELSTGEVVDTEVVEISFPGSPFKLVGILKQDSERNADPVEMERVLREWSRLQRSMRQIADDRPGTSGQN